MVATAGRSGKGRKRDTSIPYVPIDPHFLTHARTQAFVDALEGETDLSPTLLPLIIIRIFLHAGAQCIDGNLGHMSDGALRRLFAPEFQFSQGKLREVLLDSQEGFLISRDDGLHIHDWCDGGGKLHAQRAAWREKKQAKTGSSIFPEKTRRSPGKSRPKGKGKGKSKSIYQSSEVDRSAAVAPPSEPGTTDRMNCDSQNSEVVVSGSPKNGRMEHDPGAGMGEVPASKKTAAERPERPAMTHGSGVVESLDSLPPETVLSADQITQSLLDGGHTKTFGPDAGVAAIIRVRPTAWELATAMSRGLNKNASYLAKVLSTMRERGERPPPAYGEVVPALPAPNRPASIGEMRDKRRAAWRALLARYGYTLDLDWVESRCERDPDIDDERLLARCSGDWVAYRRMVDDMRDKAAQVIAETRARLGLH